MPGRPTNTTVIDACTRRLRALTRLVDENATLALNGRKLTLTEVIAIYQECLDARADLAHQRAVAKAAMRRRAAAEASRVEADQALRGWVAGEFGAESAQAIDFGFPPARKGVMSVQVKAQAVARRKATREARHTMGTRQKEGANSRVGTSSLVLSALA